MRRVTFIVAAVGVAVLLQITVLDRLPFPGGAAPDLVLVLVVTLALASGPMEGMLIGFGAGLALDVAPPATDLLGLSALVFCLVGYGCGRLRGPLERSSWLPLAAVAVGVVAGEVLYALVGLIFGDPDITWQSVRVVLPVTLVYDLLLCPFVMYAVVKLGGYRAWGTGAAREPGLLTGREPGGAGLLGGVAAGALAGAAVRDTRSGREPRLRVSASRPADAWIGGHQGGSGRAGGPSVRRRRPLQLRARDGVAGSAAVAAGLSRPSGSPARPGSGRPARLRLAAPRRGDGVLGGSVRGLLGVGLGSNGSPRSTSSARLTARAFRGGGAAGQFSNGSSGSPLRPASSPRLRARALRGGSSALAEAGRGRGGRPARLRLRSRRRDGVVGGGVLGTGASGRMGGRGMSGAAFMARRAPGAPGPLRSGRGYGSGPRFRSSGRGVSGWWERVLPRRRDGVIGGSVLSGGGRSARRGFGVSGRRRLAVWGRRSKRTGGLP